MSIDPNWVSAIANIAMAIGIYFAWRQLRADHERSRREIAVHLIASWVSTLTQRSSAARKLVETFSFEQAKALFHQEQFDVDSKCSGLLDAALEKNTQQQNNGKIHLSVEESSELRWEIVTYLNSLESILSGWRHNIADQEMIEEQFRYMVSPKDGHYILEKFREAAGGAHSFPSIDEFVSHLKAAKVNPHGKPKVA